MKRYAISILYEGTGYQYSGRTDDVTDEIQKFERRLAIWREQVTDENNKFHDLADACEGLRILDSKEKKVVFQEEHYSEELGWKKIYETIHNEYGTVRRSHWEKIQ